MFGIDESRFAVLKMEVESNISWLKIQKNQIKQKDRQIKRLQEEIRMLKRVVAEVVDYVYSENDK